MEQATKKEAVKIEGQREGESLRDFKKRVREGTKKVWHCLLSCTSFAHVPIIVPMHCINIDVERGTAEDDGDE